MKTPKQLQEKVKNPGALAGGIAKKNKAKGKNAVGNKLATNAKLVLQKSKDTVKVQEGKNVLKKSDVKNKGFNNKGSPNAVNGSAAKGGKKRKSDEGVKPEVVGNEKKNKNKGAPKSPEVQLGLKIEKLLESPKNDGPGKKNKKKKGKGAADAGQKTPEAQTPVSASPAQGKKKRKRKSKKAGGDSPVRAEPTGNQQKKQQQAGQKPKQQSAKRDKPEWDAPVPLGPFPSRANAENAVKALLKCLKERKAEKPTLLDNNEPLLLCVDFFKHPEARSITRAVLPNQILGNNPDVIFVVTDPKKNKRDHDESIEIHKELFKAHGVNNITEIIPWRKLCYEYSQFEEKRKLANRSDAFLIDSKLAHRWPAIMRKKFFRKKAPIPVRVDKDSDLKKNVDIALKKIAIILRKASLSVSPQFGHTKMNVKSLVDNLITIVTVLCDESKFPGGQANIRQINVRGSKSEAFPIYISTASPNSVVLPKASKKKREVVEGEVTTSSVTVAVHPGGRVQIKSKDKDDDEVERNTSPQKKKVKGDVESDDDLEGDSEDDSDNDGSEIDADLLEKFKSANKASEDESSDEEEIEKAEQEFLLALRKQQDALEAEAQAKSKKAGKKMPVLKEESSDEDDDDNDDLDDDSDVPDLIPAKKSKPQAQQPKKGKNAQQAQVKGKPAQNGLGKGKPVKGKPGQQAQSPAGGAGKKGPQGGKGKANQKGNNKGSPKAQQRYFNKGGKKK